MELVRKFAEWSKFTARKYVRQDKLRDSLIDAKVQAANFLTFMLMKQNM